MFLLRMGMVFPCVLPDQSTFASIARTPTSSIWEVDFRQIPRFQVQVLHSSWIHSGLVTPVRTARAPAPTQSARPGKTKPSHQRRADCESVADVMHYTDGVGSRSIEPG